MYFGPLVTLLPYLATPHSLPQLHPSLHRCFATIVCSFRGASCCGRPRPWWALSSTPWRRRMRQRRRHRLWPLGPMRRVLGAMARVRGTRRVVAAQGQRRLVPAAGPPRAHRQRRGRGGSSRCGGGAATRALPRRRRHPPHEFVRARGLGACTVPARAMCSSY